MANCTVTLTTNTAARSGRVLYEPMPNQTIGGVTLDTTRVVATVSGASYVATLIQGARYRLISRYHSFISPIFRVPAASSADLKDIIGLD